MTCGPAGAATAPAWKLLPGSGKIALEPCLSRPVPKPVAADLLLHRSCLSGSADALGRVTLAVQNDGDTAVRLRVRYARADGHVATMPGNSSIALLWGTHPPSLASREAALAKAATATDAIDDGLAALALLSGSPATASARLRRNLAAAVGGNPSDAALDRLGRELTRLMAPRAGEVQLRRSDVQRLLHGVASAKRHDVAPAIGTLVRRAFGMLVARTAVTVPGHGVATLPLRFQVPEYRPVSVISGVVEVRQLGHPRQVAAVAVAPGVPDPKTVRVEPGSVTLSTAWPERRETATVTLRGRDMFGFLAGTRRAQAVVLSDPDGRVAHARISAFQRVPRDRNLAIARVSYIDANTARGEYQAEVALFGGNADGPTLTVKLQSGTSLTTAMLIVLGGAALGLVAALLLGEGFTVLQALVTFVLAVAIAGTLFYLAVFTQTWGSYGDYAAAAALGFGITAVLELLTSLLFGQVDTAAA